MSAHLENDIMECCRQINEKCDIENQDFQFEDLHSRGWYLQILQILFPLLQQKIQMIKKLSDQTKAINAIVNQINDLEQFDTFEIDGSKIVNGDANQIAKLVQIILTLLEIAIQEGDEESGTQSQSNKHNSKQMEEMSRNLKQKKSLSDYNKPKSVQAIGNQFQKSDQEDDDIHYKNMELKQTENPIQKQKNQMKLKKQVQQYANNNDDESTQKLEQTKKVAKSKKNKNPQTNNLVKKNRKQLVTHPKSPQTLKKARSTDVIALTKKAQQDIKKTKKKVKKFVSPSRLFSPTEQQMRRKDKQHNLVVKEHDHLKRQHQGMKNRKKDFSEKNVKNLQKILNWREEQMKKQRKQYEQSMKMKLETQKQKYIKKINKLILELEREKQIQDKKQFKETLVKDNEQAVKRLTALQQWYKSKLNMMKQNSRAKNQERLLIKTGHKEIIGQIQKYLKKQNEQKLMRLTDKYRSDQNNIETDFEELKDKIIKVYKKN